MSAIPKLILKNYSNIILKKTDNIFFQIFQNYKYLQDITKIIYLNR